jgi:hypothetical protein
MSMSSMATIRNISKRNTPWMQEGSPPHGLFHPWARWAWGLANFKSCSRIGACTVWWVWHTKSMGKHCFGETEWLNQAPGALKHNSLAPEEARIAGKVLYNNIFFLLLLLRLLHFSGKGLTFCTHHSNQRPGYLYFLCIM